MRYKRLDPSRIWYNDNNDDDILYCRILVLFEKRLVERVEGIPRWRVWRVLLKVKVLGKDLRESRNSELRMFHRL
jgi:hypothetical protein